MDIFCSSGPIICEKLVSSYGKGILPPIQLLLKWYIHDAQVGAASSQNSIDFIACSEVAANHGRNVCLVAYPLAELRQETTAISGFALNSRLACLHLKYITTVFLQGSSKENSVLNVKTSPGTICCGDGDRDGFVLWPDGAYGFKHL